FPVGSCEGTYTTRDDVRHRAFDNALRQQLGTAVYAVLRDNSEDRGQDNYWIAITQNRPVLATAIVSFWNVDTNGRIINLQNECGPVGAAQQVAYRFPIAPHFVLGPFNNCPPGPGQYDNPLITV